MGVPRARRVLEGLGGAEGAVRGLLGTAEGLGVIP